MNTSRSVPPPPPVPVYYPRRSKTGTSGAYALPDRPKLIAMDAERFARRVGMAREIHARMVRHQIPIVAVQRLLGLGSDNSVRKRLSGELVWDPTWIHAMDRQWPHLELRKLVDTYTPYSLNDATAANDEA